MLAKSMREYGILTPLTLAGHDGKGRYEILSGEDRYFAAKWLNDQDDDFKVKDMPCYIVAEHMDDEEKLMIRAQLAMEMPDEGNRERSRFRLVEMLCGKADRKEINEDSITGILTNSYGFYQRYARMYKQVYRDGSDKLHEAVLSEVSPAEQKKILAEKESKSVTVHIPISTAVKICALSKKDQDKVIARANKGEKALEALKDFKD